MNSTKANLAKSRNVTQQKLAISKAKTAPKPVATPAKGGRTSVKVKTKVKEPPKVKETTFVKDEPSAPKQVEEVPVNIVESNDTTVDAIQQPDDAAKQAVNTEKDDKIIENEYLSAKAAIKTQTLAEKKKSDGFFTEITTAGAFTPPKRVEYTKDGKINVISKTSKNNSSANEIALEAKSFLELDANMSPEVKDAVIEKLFDLADMVYKAVESKHRIQTEFERFKEKSLRDKLKDETEHSRRLADVQSNMAKAVFAKLERVAEEPMKDECIREESDTHVELRIVEHFDRVDNESGKGSCESVDTIEFTLDI